MEFGAGYAKFETFPIWNIPLKHPVNLAYEAATADLNDVNMIDPFHLEAYGETTVNYNRDVEIFPVLEAMFEKIFGECPYKSPTDMGVNMAGNCIIDDEACKEASCQEIIRRYFEAKAGVLDGMRKEEEVFKIELLMKQLHISTTDRKVVTPALQRAEETGSPAAAIELPDGRIICGKNLRSSGRFRCSAFKCAERTGRNRPQAARDLPRLYRTYPDFKKQLIWEVKIPVCTRMRF